MRHIDDLGNEHQRAFTTFNEACGLEWTLRVKEKSEYTGPPFDSRDSVPWSGPPELKLHDVA